MEEYYKIKEIARLYNLCADTLRYYEEQGVLSPLRGENNYRLYGIQDICNLNIIQNLRSLDIPLSKIRDYMETRSVASTLALLEEETGLIDKRIAALRELRRGVVRRASDIRAALDLPVGECRLLQLEDRPCYLLSEGITMEENIDFLLKKLEKKHEKRLRTFGDRQMGATLDSQWLEAGVYNHYSNAFFICEGIRDYDRILPGGLYGSVVYKGRYEAIAQALPALWDWLAQQGLSPASPPLELYHIDTHDSGRKEEYLTELQIQVLEP